MTPVPRARPAAAALRPLSTLFQRVSAALLESPRPRCLLFPDPSRGWRAISSERLFADLRRLAAGLAVFGVEPGTRVAVLTGDARDAWRGELAALACGACCVPLAPAAPDERLRSAIGETGVRLALVSPDQLPRLMQWRPELPDLDLIVLFRRPDTAGAVPATLAAEVCAAGEERLAAEPRLLEEARARVSEHDPAYVVPGGKGPVSLTHAALGEVVRALAEALPLGERDRVLSLAPFDRISARSWHLACLCQGAALALGNRAEPDSARMRALRPTVVLGCGRDLDGRLTEVVEAAAGRSPWAAARLRWASRSGVRAASAGLAADRLAWKSTWRSRRADRGVLGRIREAAGGSLRFAVSVDEPLDERRVLFFLGLGLPVLEGLGVPETGGILCQNLPEAFRPGTVGRPVPGARVRVDDAGQVWVQGAIVSSEGPDPGSAAVRKSWFRTDLTGERDEGGYLRVRRTDS